MTALVVALTGAYGVFLIYTSVALGWRGMGMGPVPAAPRARRRDRATAWLLEAGLDGVRPAQFAATSAFVALAATALAYAILGSLVPALPVGVSAACLPAVSYRARRRQRRDRASEAWPRLIEEIALLCGSMGRSVPQALFDVGRRAPDDMQAGFAAAQREWLLTTDFERTVGVLKAHLADPTADATCETLLVAHELGGTDLERRLAALVEDRRTDVGCRKDARARQAGARFSRRFVLIVPVGMALFGMSIGDARQAFRSGFGQLAAVAAVGVVMACWMWAGRIMRLPDEERVFAAGPSGTGTMPARQAGAGVER